MAIFEKCYKRISIGKGVGEIEWDWENGADRVWATQQMAVLVLSF